MAVYPADQRPDFWKLQVTTTRNVTSNWFVDWFCGGLQYQVDHHLFPMLPRHNLAKVTNLTLTLTLTLLPTPYSLHPLYTPLKSYLRFMF